MLDTGDLLGLEKSICGCVQDTNGQVLVQRPQRVLTWVFFLYANKESCSRLLASPVAVAELVTTPFRHRNQHECD